MSKLYAKKGPKATRLAKKLYKDQIIMEIGGYLVLETTETTNNMIYCSPKNFDYSCQLLIKDKLDNFIVKCDPYNVDKYIYIFEKSTFVATIRVKDEFKKVI